MTLNFEKIFTQTIQAEWLEEKRSTLDVLRLDRIHDVISGNKWFKLKYYFREAAQKNYTTIVTCGGPYSNHIIATAYACRQQGFESIGIIRGEEPAVLSDTLQDARDCGMRLEFVNRSTYRDRNLLKRKFSRAYWIDEGGYGLPGARGAAEIMECLPDPGKYSFIVCAVGTGTMIAGIIAATDPQQEIIGVSVMKGNHALQDSVSSLLSGQSLSRRFKIVHDFHFGGYAKHPPELIRFMNDTWQMHTLPTDIVYTAKTVYATKEMITRDIIPPRSNVLVIHSGGLQGNSSLPEKLLAFE